MTEVLQTSARKAEIAITPQGGDGAALADGTVFDPLRPSPSRALATMNVDAIYSNAMSRCTPDFDNLPLADATETAEVQPEPSRVIYPSADADGSGGLSRRGFLKLSGLAAGAAVLASCLPEGLFKDEYTKRKKMVATGEFPDNLTEDEKLHIIKEVTWNEYVNRFFPKEKDTLIPPGVELVHMRDFAKKAVDTFSGIGYQNLQPDSFYDLGEIYDFNNRLIVLNKDAPIWQPTESGVNQFFKTRADMYKELAYIMLTEYSVSLADMKYSNPPYTLIDGDDVDVENKLGLSIYVRTPNGDKVDLKLFQYAVADAAAGEVAGSIGLTVPYESAVVLTARKLLQMVEQRLGITTGELLTQVRNDTHDIREFFLFLGNKNLRLQNASDEDKKLFGLKVWALITLFSFDSTISADEAIDKMDKILAPYNINPSPPTGPDSTPPPIKSKGQKFAGTPLDMLPLPTSYDIAQIGNFLIPMGQNRPTSASNRELHPVVQTVFRRFLRPKN